MQAKFQTAAKEAPGGAETRRTETKMALLSFRRSQSSQWMIMKMIARRGHNGRNVHGIMIPMTADILSLGVITEPTNQS